MILQQGYRENSGACDLDIKNYRFRFKNCVFWDVFNHERHYIIIQIMMSKHDNAKNHLVQAEKKHWGYKYQKEWVVPCTNTVINPWAMMVKAFDTFLAVITVLGSIRLFDFTNRANLESWVIFKLGQEWRGFWLFQVSWIP